MKTDARNKVLQQYGEKVVEILDRTAIAMCAEAAAYYANDAEGRYKHGAKVELLCQELALANGPVAAFFIEPTDNTIRILWILIDSFHDLDKRIDKDFDGTDGVLTDSETSSPFIYTTAAAAPKVIKVLQEFFHGVFFAAKPVDEDSRINTVLTNWNEAKAWTELPR